MLAHVYDVISFVANLTPGTRTDRSESSVFGSRNSPSVVIYSFGATLIHPNHCIRRKVGKDVKGKGGEECATVQRCESGHAT